MSLGETKFSNVTLILFDFGQATDAQITKCLNQLATVQAQVEVLLVDRVPRRASRNGAISHHTNPETFPSLDLALHAAKHPIVTIVEEGCEIEVDLWKRMVSQAEQREIQSLVFSRVQKRKLKNFFLWISLLTVRLFLGTKKSALTKGWVVVHQSAIQKTLADRINQPINSLTDLLAMAKVNRQRVHEYDLGDVVNGSTDDNRLSTKTIFLDIKKTIYFWWDVVMFPRDRQELQALEKKTSLKNQWLIAVAIVALGIFTLFHSLSFPLFEPDEARNAQLALNALESGQWMSLSLDQEPYWDKPPLQIWAIALSYKIFGVSQYSTRIPCAIASLLTLVLMLVVGKRLIGFRAAALGASLLLLTSGFVLAGRYVTMDASLTAATTATMLFSWLAVRDQSSKRMAFLAGVSCGIGFLIKGPIIAVLCLPPLLLASWLNRGQTSLRKSPLPWIWFLTPTLLITAPWFVAMTIIHPDFLGYFFWKHHVVRFASAFNHREPFWYYAIGIFLFMAPASYLLPSLAKYLTSSRPTNRLWRTKDQGFLFLTAIWIIGFFTMAESKLPTYIVPAFPPICLLMGVLLNRKVFHHGLNLPEIADGISHPTCGNQQRGSHNIKHTKKTFLEGIPKRGPYELTLWTGIACIAMAFLGGGLLIPALVFATTASVVVGSTLWQRTDSSFHPIAASGWAGFAITSLILVSFSAHYVLPSFANFRSIHSATENLKSEDQFQNAPIVFYGRESFGASLTHNPQHVVSFKANQTRQLVDFLNWNPTTIIVSSKEQMKSLRADLPWTIKLEKHDMRHVYTSQPDKAVIARVMNNRIYK